MSVSNDTKKCPVCDKDHSIFTCKEYNLLEPKQRLELVQKRKLCTICLRAHSTRDCRAGWACYICKGKHNTSVYVDNKNYVVANANCDNKNVLLATAEIYVLSYNGTPFKYRALIDQGSMSSFVTEKVAQQLNLKRKYDSTTISVLGDGSMQTSNGQTKILFHSLYNNKTVFDTHALILPKLTSWLPAENIEFSAEYKEYQLADPHYNIAGRIDVILGSDVYKDIILNNLTKGSLLAQKTQLGWMLSGVVDDKDNLSHKTCMIAVSNENDELLIALKQFWKTEEKINQIPKWSADEMLCEKIYTETTYRDRDGRYVCRLPFKESEVIGRSKHIAVGNMLQLEKKFKKNPEFKDKYVKCMQEYLELGHAIPARKNENYFLRKKIDKPVYEC
jgi:hypothetical protein